MRTTATAIFRPIHEHWDTALGISLILLGLAGLRLVNDSAFWNRWMELDATAVSVGQVNATQGEVRLRPAAATAWHDLDLARETSVSGGDTIFTGNDSSADITLKDGTHATLNSSSLIVIQVSSETGDWWQDFLGTRRDPSITEIEKGSLTLKLDGRNQKLKVRIRNKTFEISSPDAPSEVTLQPDRLVQMGDSHLQIRELGALEKNTLLSGRGAALVVDRSGALSQVRSQVSILSPSHGKSVSLLPGETLPLKWNLLQAVEKLTLQWRPMDSENRPGAIEETEIDRVQAGVHQIQRKTGKNAGTYQWRLKTPQWSGEWSEVSVHTLLAPQITGPITESRVTDTAHLSWEAVRNGLVPEVEVTGLSPNIPPRLYRAFSTGLELRLPHGEYSWRVRTRDSHGLSSAWSTARKLTVAPWDRRGGSLQNNVGAKTTTVVPLAPVSAVKLKPISSSAKKIKLPPTAVIEILPTLENSEASANTRLGKEVILDRVTVTLAWKPIAGISEYQISIFESGGKLVKEGKTTRPKFVVELRSLQENAYSYQVGGILPSGKLIQSAKAPIRVMLSPPLIQRPKTGTTVEAGTSAVLMTWEKTAITERYDLQVAKDTAFHVLVVNQSQSANFYRFVTEGKKGLFFLRVKSVSGKRESPWSDAVQFELK